MSIRAQTLLEYVTLLGLVVVVLVTMTTYVRRGVQGMVKAVADQVGVQKNSDQTFDETGHLISSYAASSASIDKQTKDFLGVTTYTYGDVTSAQTNVLINQGVTEQNPI